MSRTTARDPVDRKRVTAKEDGGVHLKTEGTMSLPAEQERND